MNITNNTIKHKIKKLNSYRLEQRMSEYPEEKREGKTDAEIFSQEVLKLVKNYEDLNDPINNRLTTAKKLLNKTRNGQINPLNPQTGEPAYSETEIKEAKALFNEYLRLKRIEKWL